MRGDISTPGWWCAKRPVRATVSMIITSDFQSNVAKFWSPRLIKPLESADFPICSVFFQCHIKNSHNFYFLCFMWWLTGWLKLWNASLDFSDQRRYWSADWSADWSAMQPYADGRWMRGVVRENISAPFLCYHVPEKHRQISQHSVGRFACFSNGCSTFCGRGSVVGLKEAPQRVARHLPGDCWEGRGTNEKRRPRRY